AQVHPTGYIWYDELIISRNKIADPATGSGTLPQADTIGPQTSLSIVSPAKTDAVPPSISILSPSHGSTVSGSGVTLSAVATDNVGVVGVRFQLDGIDLGAEITSPPYSVLWNSVATNNGYHLLTGVARDSTGNLT